MRAKIFIVVNIKALNLFELIPIWKRIEGRKEKRKIYSWGPSFEREASKKNYKCTPKQRVLHSSLKSHAPMLIASWRWWRISVNNEPRSIIHSTLSIVLVISGQKCWFLAVFFVLTGTNNVYQLWWPLLRCRLSRRDAQLLLLLVNTFYRAL